MSNPTPHIHGGNLDDSLQRYGIASKQAVIDFSVNVNPLGPPAIIRRQWPDWFKNIASYPSQNGGGLENFYRQRFNLPEGSVLSGNGSIEMIYLVPRALKIKTALVFIPSFHDYLRAFESAGAAVTKRPLIKTNSMWNYPLDDNTLTLIKQMDAVVLGNPNNPTGSLLKGQAILELAERFPRTWFLIDEAFSQFLDGPEIFSLLHPEKLFKNIIIFHSLTKFYALPGLRMGAAISHPKTIARLAAIKEPWTVNALAEQAAGSLMDCGTYEMKTRHLITEQRNIIFDALNQMPAVEAFETPANFIFARLNDAVDPDELMRLLLKKGAFIRDCRNFEGLDGNYFRIAVRGKDDNQRLVQALADILGNKHD